MAHRSREPQPTFTVVDLLAGYIALGVLGWVLGGVAGIALGWGWATGSRVGRWTGLGLFTALVIRTIWLASSGSSNESGTDHDA